ncbi:MAG: hypothetical protein ACK41T_12170, partial [Pseudobdellovibrio sp.]
MKNKEFKVYLNRSETETHNTWLTILQVRSIMSYFGLIVISLLISLQTQAHNFQCKNLFTTTTPFTPANNQIFTLQPLKRTEGVDVSTLSKAMTEG